MAGSAGSKLDIDLNLRAGVDILSPLGGLQSGPLPLGKSTSSYSVDQANRRIPHLPPLRVWRFSLGGDWAALFWAAQFISFLVCALFDSVRHSGNGHEAARDLVEKHVRIFFFCQRLRKQSDDCAVP